MAKKYEETVHRKRNANGPQSYETMINLNQVKETQIKMTQRYRFLPIRLAKSESLPTHSAAEATGKQGLCS